MRRTVTVLALGSLVWVFGCSSILPGNPASYQREDEEVIVSIEHKSQPARAEALPVLAVAAIPWVADFVIKQVEGQIDTEASKYTADYYGFDADDRFYGNEMPLTTVTTTRKPEVDVTGVRLLRRVTIDGKHVDAFDLHMRLVPAYDSTAFRLIPDKMRLCFAKAKAPAQWLPEGSRGIDIDVTTVIEALWTDGDQASHYAPIANLSVPIRNIPIGGALCKDTNPTSFTASEWFPAVPRTVISACEKIRIIYLTQDIERATLCGKIPQGRKNP